MWRRTSRTCQIMELDEGPPDHARSTWERRNTAGGHHISNMSMPPPPSTMDIPAWVHSQSPGTGQREELVGCSWDRLPAGRVARAKSQGPGGQTAK